jgi:hypothetical protein
MNAARTSHTATLLPDGRVLIAGGYLPSAEIYDPRLEAWLPTEEMTSVRTFDTATLLLDGRILFAGGIDDTNTAIATSELWFGAPGS